MMSGPAQCPIPLTSPCTTFMNSFIAAFRPFHHATTHLDASGAHLIIDPTPFLSAIVTVSVALVAIIGGLLVARFVGLDTDRRSSRKILAAARDRLGAARGRAQAARGAILRWDAEEFFSTREVVEAVVDDGIVSPTELVRMASWPHGPDELVPFVTEVTEDARLAREAIPPRIGSDDRFWTDFRRRHPDLPKIRWPGVWAHVYDLVAREKDEAERAVAEARRWAEPAKSSLDLINTPRFFMPTFSPPPPQTDYGVIEARRSDELRTNHARAQQQVEDLDAELLRLEQEHAEIVRPDGRLWFAVAILIILTVVGIVVPLGVMATGPRDLAQVRWVLYPFLASLALLIGYIVWYLAKLTERKRDRAAAS